MASRFCAIAIALTSVLAQGLCAQAPDRDTRISNILGDWKERQGLVKTARYVVSGTTEFKDRNCPPGNPVRPLRYELLLDFEHNRHRLEWSQDVISGDEGNTKFITRNQSFAFDGKTFQALYHRVANGLPEEAPDLGIHKGDMGKAQFDSGLYPVFFAHGVVPTGYGDLRVDKLSIAYEPDDFEVRGRQTFNGRNCTVVRTDPVPGHIQPSFGELWIDQSQKSAIHRYVNYVGSNPSDRTDVQWKQTDLGWWPEKWTDTWTDNGKVRRIDRLRIDSFEANPAVSDSDFTFQAEPGMKVKITESPPRGGGMNPDFPSIKTYLISPTGSWQEISAKGFTTMDGKVLPPDRGVAWVWWLGVTGAVVGAVIFVVYVAWRRRRAV
jgi:hypothetical protein